GFDQINSGNLTPGQLQSFALTASAGAHLYFDQLLEEQTDLRITLQAPDSSEVFSLSSARDSGLVFLAESGGYTLTVENESTADTAPFAFRILSSDDAEVLTFGSTTSGSFAANGAAFGAVLYRFEAVAGQHFHARPEFGDIAHDWALHLANRDRLDHGNFGNLLSWAVASSGTLFLVLSGDSPTETEYSFSAGLEDRSARNVATGTRFDSLTDLPPAGVDRLQFEATAGDRIYVDHLIGTDALRLLLYQPDGTLVFSNIRLDSDVDPYTTTATGTHYLFVESSNDEAEAYALRILLDRETPVLPLGPSQSGTLDPGSQTEIFQFDLSVPTRLRLDREVLSGSAVFRLFDPSGDSIPINNNSSIPIETTEPGTYLFAVIGTSDTTTDYDFQLTPLVETTFDLPTNTTVTGLIEDRNQLTFHTFSGSAGQVIRYRAVSPEPAFNTTYHVYGPGAELLFDGRALDDQLPVELPVDGDYIFVFEKPDETTETFGFRVQDFSGAPLLGGSKLLEGDFVEAEGDALIRVEALAGQTITLTFALDTLSKDAVGILDEFENLSTGQGGTENGYRAIEAAARLPFRQGAAVNFILVTDEDCDCAAPAAELRPELQELLNDIGAKLNTVVNLRIRDGEEPPNDAVGVDSDAIYYRPDGAAGFTTSSTGTVEAGLAPANATARDTVEDYAELAWATGGAAWDLNQLREGGLTAQSFTSAFVTIKAEEILEDLASLDVIASDSSAPFVNLTGPLADVEGGSNAEFSVELVGEENARSFDLLFIRPRSGNILGSLPVVLGYGYRYVVQANDPDGDLLSFSASTAPLGASIDSTTGLFEWQPTATGVFPLTIGVDDGRGGNDQQSFEIEVFAPSGNSVPIIEGTPQGNAIAGRDFSKRIKASDPDGDTLLYLVEEGPDGLTLDIRSGQLTWTPEAGQIGENRIVVRVLDGRGGIAVADFILEVVADSDNRAPAFESAPLSAGAPGEVYRYDAVAVDPDGDTVRYSLAFGPDGMAVGADSGVLTWRPRSDQSGTFSVVLRASDAFGAASLQRFSVRVSGLNSAPVFTSAPPLFAGADQAYGYLPVVQEADGDNLDFFLDQAPAAMTVDQSTGRLLWVPGAADLGLHPITLRALDARGASAVQTFDLNVLSTLDNEAPEIVSTPATLVRLDSVWFYNVLANDPEGFPVEVSLDEAPEGMSVDANGLVSWNTVARSLGSYSVAVRAEDPLGAATVQNFELALVENRPNTAPSITTTPGTSAVAGREYAYDPIATDPEADALTWRLDASPTGMSLSPDSGALRWTPRIDQVGTHTVELSVIDSESASSLQEFEIVVHPVNTAPLIASAPPTTVAAEAAYNYIVAATDAEGDAVVFTLVNGPAGMLLDSNSGLLTWLPELGDVGTHAIEILASDGFGGSARQLFDLEVVDTTPNEPARITSTPALAAQAGLLYSYQLTAEDPESQPLTFSLESGPAGMTLNATGGLVEWQPGTAQAGPNSVELWVTDSAGNVSYQSFTVTVLLENANPAILSAPTGPATVGLPYVYEVVANDPDGDSLQYRIVAGPDEMTIRSDGRITWTPSIGDVGVVAIRIEAFDLLGGVSGQEFNLPVLIDNEPPQVVIQLSENPVLVGTQVEVEVRATDDVAVVSRSAEFGGIPLALDANGRATVVAENPGLFSITATATDGLGNVGMAEQTLVASETLNDEAPFVFIESPLPSSTITQPVLVRATVTDEDLAFYALEIAPADGGDYWEIARGGSVVDDAVTGTLDPTLLDNGIYKLRLVAEDVLGNRSADEFTFDVAGALKLGNYAVSFTDMEVPVAGIPITVSRTYDTLRANRNGRVGYGWRIDVLDTRLRTTLSGDVQEGDEILPAFRFGTRVYVTLPDGRREAFTFEPKLNNRFFPIFDPTFVADPGVDSTLTVDIHDLRFNDVTGEFESYIDRLPYNPAAPAFGGVYRLTTKEGLTYRIEGISGDLSRISDRNGNTLMIDDSGIVANTGERVTFETDPSGRIAAVIDPSGNRVEYGYDAAGDLVRVEDREGNVTTFHYLEDPAHYLSRIEDPLGRTGDRSEYDAEGRLVRRFNGTSGVLEYAYDPGNSLQTSTDALGNTTTYEYDARGNIVAEINPLGGIIRSTYDANDRLLSLTDELGRETLYEYDDGGNVLSRTAPGGLVTSYTYNSLDLPLTITDPLGHTITHTYDAAGNLTSTTDKNGKVTTMVYDPRGNRIRHVAPTGDVTEYEYDGRSRLLRRTDPNGAVRSYTYDANNNPSSETIMVTSPDGPPTELTTLMEYDSEDRLVRQTNAAGEETRFEYDGLDNLTAVVDPSGNRNEIVYNAAGAIASQSFPEGRVVSRTYDLKDRLVSRTAPDGSITRYEYDAKDRLVAVIHPDATPDNPDDNPRERFAYDAADARTEVTDANGATTRYEYGTVGRIVRVIDPLGAISEFTYDDQGNKLTETDPLGNITRFEYDAEGNRVKTTFADGAIETAQYDALGRIIAKTNALGATTGFTYATGTSGRNSQLATVTDPLGNVHEYEYDEAGRLVLRRDPLDRETRITYDEAGRRTGLIRPLGGAKTMEYDENGGLVAVINPDGSRIEMSYDSAGRRIRKDLPDATDVVYEYDLSDRLVSVADGRGLTEFTYDSRNWLSERREPDGRSIAYSYDELGRVTRRDLASGSIHSTYDAVGRPLSVTDPDGGVTTHAYDLAGNLLSTDFPNGVREARTYDQRNRVLSISWSLAGVPFDGLQYVYDLAGRRTQITFFDGTTHDFGYDLADRLVSETISPPSAGARMITYAYDAAGNRTLRTDSAEGQTVYAYDANDRLISATSGSTTITYNYDINGNLTSIDDGSGTVPGYTWDAEGRLLGVGEISYEYDFSGIRVARTEGEDTVRYLVDHRAGLPAVLEEYAPDGTTLASFVRSHRLVSQERSAGRSYYRRDALGSVIALDDALGQSLNTYRYDGFGRPLTSEESVSNSFRFTGEPYDAGNDLLYLRARYYQPGVGRFTSPDPFVGNPMRPSSYHAYQYASANPVNITDPTGKWDLTGMNMATAIVADFQSAFGQAGTTA
ncbi:MAG: putative Ig domain-containing protein, partial [Gammaproteobacteria bacterium]